jgi:hypothetical protein
VDKTFGFKFKGQLKERHAGVLGHTVGTGFMNRVQDVWTMKLSSTFLTFSDPGKHCRMERAFRDCKNTSPDRQR